MNISDMAKGLTPEVYQRLQLAAETGKWPDGTQLTEQQHQQTVQLVMLYQSQVLKTEQHFAVGEDGQIVHRDRSYLQNQFKQEGELEQPVEDLSIKRFKHDDI